MKSAPNTDVSLGSIHSNVNSCILKKRQDLGLEMYNLKYSKSTNNEATLLEIQFCWASFHIAITVKVEEAARAKPLFSATCNFPKQFPSGLLFCQPYSRPG